MRIKSLTINSREEFISKIVREVLNLFKVEIVGRRGEADFAQLSVINRVLSPSADGTGKGLSVETRLILFDLAGKARGLMRRGEGVPDEREAAGLHRLIKLNLYHIFREELGYAEAPWGILHGVRPTKIVHRLIRGGADEAEVIGRLKADYAASDAKACLIVPMAFRQLPFLKMGSERTVSVYVGIPFCLTRCLYCSFPSHILPKEKELMRFMESFKKDLMAAREDMARLSLRVQNIYVGGGTPTSLPDAFFAQMLEMVYNAFYNEDLYEFTVEAGRPDSITEDKIRTMKRLGVTRVSVNPQTMQERTLKLIGRQHSPEDVVAMYKAIRSAGIEHINMDLILGLPGETARDVEDTMEKVTALAPDDITLHALAIKRGSRLKFLMEEQHVELPSDEETRRMSEVALRFIKDFGYQPYYLYRQGYMSGDLENIGCAKRGAESLYNIQIMEEQQTIVGIGGSATTKVRNVRAGRLFSSFNPKDLKTYENDIDTYIEKRRRLLDEAYA